MAEESGIETPAAEHLIRHDRKCKNQKLSNEAWVYRTDPDARIARMQDGRRWRWRHKSRMRLVQGRARKRLPNA
ncbi:hypothetical protein, partial [Roseibium sp. RKSG952]|uniref:hypothetical protein n=1 Tax=Roseibium sp. RKSG952 TaxID=2529384 RepID=UPI001AD8C92D